MYEGKTVLVVGMARSGLAAAELMLSDGAKVILSDNKPLDSFEENSGDIEALLSRGAENALGSAPDAYTSIADIIVISPGVPINLPFIKMAKDAGKEVIGELELSARYLQGMLVAITGTNGKSTTTTLLGEIFKNAGKLAYVAGNIGLPLCAVVSQIKSEDVAVVEVSSFQLESIESFRPRCAAMLNLTEDHLNRHGNMENYIAVKMRIFENMKSGDFAVLNQDDALIAANAKGISAKKVWYSRKQKVSFGVWVDGANMVFGTPASNRVICSASEVLLPGGHNLENAMAAAAMAAVCGVQLPVIRHTLRTFTGIEHRIETVGEIAGVRYINDSKGTNVDATIKAVEAMERPTILLLGGYDKKTDFDPLSRAINQSKIKAVIALGETRLQIKESLIRCGFGEITIAEGFRDAVCKAREMAVYGDNVLLSPACASYDMFRDFEHRGAVFKEIVKEIAQDCGT